MDTGTAFLIVIITLAIGLLVYFIPTIVAGQRDHYQKNAIFVLNLLLGCTLVGWVAALVWACTLPSRTTVITAPVTAPLPTNAEELARYAQLRDSGVLTEAEFHVQMQKLLG